MRKIKLIWDFKGREVEHFAIHHAKHLEEFLLKEKYTDIPTGYEILSDYHAIAYMIVNQYDMFKFRDILKPHRAILAE